MELADQVKLYYVNARYYDATIGRFINVDPIQDGTNWYVYCNNNPLSFVDPTGLNDKKTDQSEVLLTDKDINWEKPVFICGHRKTGTTMLINLFDNHPDLLVYPDDSGFWYVYYPLFDGENISNNQTSAFFSKTNITM